MYLNIRFQNYIKVQSVCNVSDFMNNIVKLIASKRKNSPEEFCKKGILRNFGKLT